MAGGIILLALIAVLIGNYVVRRIQVGGELYEGIAMKRRVVDELAALSSAFGMIRGDVYAHSVERRDHLEDRIRERIASIDGMFSELRTAGGNPTPEHPVACVSCHEQALVDAVSGSIVDARDAWEPLRKKLDQDLEQLTINSEAGRGALDAELEGLQGIAQDVRFSYDTLNQASDLQVQQIEEEAALLRTGYKIGSVVLAGILLLIVSVLSVLIVRPLRAASSMAQEVAKQIVAAVDQQNEAINSTATAVSETTTALEEIRQTSKMTAHSIQAVSEISQRSRTVSQETLPAIEQGIAGMRKIREQVDGISRNILELSERSAQIGDIVQRVAAIAEQSNLLAVNAAIEAAKAGEHGRGFSVVANEVKALAAQSKEATGRIRAILVEIQQSSNAAVMVTEEGTRRADDGVSLIGALAQRFSDLGQVIEENADSAHRISAAVAEQLAGVEQITAAMRGVEVATQQNSAGAQKIQQASRRVADISEQLNALIVGRSS